MILFKGFINLRVENAVSLKDFNAHVTKTCSNAARSKSQVTPSQDSTASSSVFSTQSTKFSEKASDATLTSVSSSQSSKAANIPSSDIGFKAQLPKTQFSRNTYMNSCASMNPSACLQPVEPVQQLHSYSQNSHHTTNFNYNCSPAQSLQCTAEVETDYEDSFTPSVQALKMSLGLSNNNTFHQSYPQGNENYYNL